VYLLRRLLILAGVTNPSEVVADAGGALRYLTGQPPFDDRATYPLPGVIITDVRLPDSDDFEVLQWMRGRRELASLPVFIMSGMEDPRLIRRAYEMGAIAFLAKPSRVEDLEKLLDGFPQYFTRSHGQPHYASTC
jgi:two-component system response regulator